MPRYAIISARPVDVPLIPAIELAAARLLSGHAPESVLGETTSEEVLAQAQRDGHLWVAVADDVAVGFAQVTVLEGEGVHLEEVDVHPAHGRRGLGTKLVMRVCAWAAAEGHPQVTLTTFREVPWNMPFYAKLGFAVVSPDALSPTLVTIVEAERRRGLDSSRRVVMKREG